MIITDWISPFHTTPGRSYDLSVQRHHQAFLALNSMTPSMFAMMYTRWPTSSVMFWASFPVTSYLPVVSRFLAVQYEAEIPLLFKKKMKKKSRIIEIIKYFTAV